MCVWLPVGVGVVDDITTINSNGGCFYLIVLDEISNIYVGWVNLRNIELSVGD